MNIVCYEMFKVYSTSANNNCDIDSKRINSDSSSDGSKYSGSSSSSSSSNSSSNSNDVETKELAKRGDIAIVLQRLHSP